MELELGMQPVIACNTTSYERILVIADIHGGHKALMALLAKLQPGQGDLLVTLGDYIDRGPDSRAVIAELRNLSARGNSLHLRGNHEGMLLMAMSHSPEMAGLYDESVPSDTTSLAGKIHMWLSNGGLETLDSYCRDAGAAAQKSLAGLKKALHETNWLGPRTLSDRDALIKHYTELIPVVPTEDYVFLRKTCVDALAIDRFILVHGGHKAHCSLRKQTLATLHWGSPSDGCTSLLETLVVGHQIMRQWLPKRIGSLIYLDTGSSCIIGGRLTCMDILSLQFWQADQNGHICHSGKLTSKF